MNFLLFNKFHGWPKQEILLEVGISLREFLIFWSFQGIDFRRFALNREEK